MNSHDQAERADTKPASLTGESSGGRQLGQLHIWTVQYGRESRLFNCQASEIQEAIKLCELAHPGEPIGSAARDDMAASAPLYYLNWADPQGKASTNGAFVVNIDDQRSVTNKMYVDIGLGDGSSDDALAIQFDISKIPGCEGNGKQQLRMNDDHLRMSIHRLGNQYVLKSEVAFTVQAPVRRVGVTH